MSFSSRYRKIETSDELIKKSIVAKILYAQGERSNLFRILNNPSAPDMEKILAFRRFIDAFYTLFQDTRHNIGRSMRIQTEWNDEIKNKKVIKEGKETRYNNYLNRKYKEYKEKDMKEGLELFEEFTGDMVKIDLFKILDEIGEGGESEFDDEEIVEEEDDGQT